ncbi:putative receptor-like protein kinase [Senna tora]|uniref:Putative receptor-like protein kinase n=1 Tax=Senna tora TaxID=362788 RepID=A0A834SK21_9FABA|nr:putative receptor-like protein kinase [Senna tora]
MLQSYWKFKLKDLRFQLSRLYVFLTCTSPEFRFQDGGVSLVKEVKDFNRVNDIFHSEVQLLGHLHHRHLLALKGFSMGYKRLLIFDNIENGSLKEHLNDPLKTPLSWRMRLQIAVGVVAALEYLFLFIEPPRCHVSISSSNIMLDENFTAKLSDYGLLTCIGNSAPYSKDCTGQKNGNIVFQLGVLILELITGQSSEMEDPDLGNSYDSKELKSLLAVAKLCIKSRGKPAFTIPQLFRYLQKKFVSRTSSYGIISALGLEEAVIGSHCAESHTVLSEHHQAYPHLHHMPLAELAASSSTPPPC